MTGEPNTILVYSDLELIGDGFMKIPFLRALRAAWPQARITWMAGKGKTVFADALRPLTVPYLDEIIEEAMIGSRARQFLRRPLRRRSFDMVIDTQRGVLTALTLRRVRHGKFVSGAADFLFSDAGPRLRYRKPHSMIEQMLDLLRAASGRAIEFAPPPALPAEYVTAACTALPDRDLYVGLVPGAGGKSKCWPRERYIALASHAGTWGVRPVFILGPDESGWFGDLRAAAPDAAFPLQDSRISTSISKSPLYTMALGRRLGIAVTNDCGPAHILSAVDTPLISLFGHTSAAKFAPATPDLTVIRAQDFGSDRMEEIPLTSVVAALERKLTLWRDTGLLTCAAGALGSKPARFAPS